MLVGAETLGSSGAYTLPEDLEVLAPTELWKNVTIVGPKLEFQHGEIARSKL
jgi:hypothetical protein